MFMDGWNIYKFSESVIYGEKYLAEDWYFKASDFKHVNDWVSVNSEDEFWDDPGCSHFDGNLIQQNK